MNNLRRLAASFSVLFAMASMLVVAQERSRQDGVVVEVPGRYSGPDLSLLVLKEDGTFEWSLRSLGEDGYSLSGTWRVDRRSLKLVTKRPSSSSDYVSIESVARWNDDAKDVLYRSETWRVHSYIQSECPFHSALIGAAVDAAIASAIAGDGNRAKPELINDRDAKGMIYSLKEKEREAFKRIELALIKRREHKKNPLDTELAESRSSMMEQASVAARDYAREMVVTASAFHRAGRSLPALADISYMRECGPEIQDGWDNRGYAIKLKTEEVLGYQDIPRTEVLFVLSDNRVEQRPVLEDGWAAIGNPRAAQLVRIDLFPSGFPGASIDVDPVQGEVFTLYIDFSLFRKTPFPEFAFTIEPDALVSEDGEWRYMRQ